MADDGAPDARDAVEAFATRIDRALLDLRAGVAAMGHAPDGATPDAGAAEPSPAPPAAPSPAPPAGDDPGAVRIPWDIEAPARVARRRGRRVLTAVAVAAGAAVAIAVLFVSVGPRVLPYRTYEVRSGSMEPAIDTGALVVLVEVDASELERGDIVTFRRPSGEAMLVTHRIVAIETDGDGGRVFVTKGDANRDVDPWRVPGSGIGWRYAFDVPYLGYAFGALGSAPVRVALVAIPAAALALIGRGGNRHRGAAHAA